MSEPTNEQKDAMKPLVEELRGLNYSAINIAAAEEKTGKSFFDAFRELGGTPSVSAIVFLLRAGGLSDADVDKEFAKGIDRCFTLIMRGLNTAGFLGEIDLDIEKMQTDMKKAKDEAKNTETSPSTGKA